jgi:hypothetical protein
VSAGADKTPADGDAAEAPPEGGGELDVQATVLIEEIGRHLRRLEER